MLKVSLSDGRTLQFALDTPESAARWRRFAGDPSAQRRITALTIAHLGVNYTIPRPCGFEGVFITAEDVPPEGRNKGCQKIICHAGEVRLTMVVHSCQRATRVQLERVGKLVHNPQMNVE